MPWKHSSIEKERERFALLVLEKKQSLTDLCRQFGISRPTGDKWLRRYGEEGRKGLADRRCGPRRAVSPQRERWRQEVLGLRRAHRHWGGDKIWIKLAEKQGRRRLPSIRSIERWIAEAGKSQPRQRRAPVGPVVAYPGLTQARRRHQVWTVDFKGWYRTRDGQRQEPLTIRDMWTRYVLAIRLLPNQSDAVVRAAFRQVFRQHGLPTAIRVDNGSPFCGLGALGLTRLSVWWTRLGIRVEFTRRARPGDNAAHEQLHRLYAREVAAQPSADRHSEQRRAERWRRQYNEQRPHAALQQRTPASCYRRSARGYEDRLPELIYPKAWSPRRVRSHGDIKWEGQLRYIGRAFVGERIALQLIGADQWAVYLGRLLIGHLHAEESTGMRPAVRRSQSQQGRAATDCKAVKKR